MMEPLDTRNYEAAFQEENNATSLDWDCTSRTADKKAAMNLLSHSREESGEV